MDQIDTLVEGLIAASSPAALVLIVVGVAAGIIVGAIPGLGPTVGMAIALPIVLRFPPELSILLLMSILVGAAFGNSMTAIVLGIPGTPSAILSTIEAKPFREAGQELRAVTVGLLSSVVGQSLAVIALILVLLPLADFALGFLFPEIFALGMLALLTVVGLARASPAKGAMAAAFGFSLGLVGPDPITSQIRFGFGIPELYTGLPTVAALIGLLAFREVFVLARRSTAFVGDTEISGLRWPHLRWFSAYRKQLGSTAVGTGVGTVVGALPGAGPAIATFVTYGALQIPRRTREELGKGSLRAIAGIDSAQNAASTTALVPTLALGIPGSAPMVIVLALLTTRGVIPGPDIGFTEPALIQAIFGGLVIACAVLLIVGYVIVGPAVYISRLSHPGVVSGSLVLMVAGVYSMRWSLVDVWVALAVGVIAYLMSERGYPVAPAALGLILAPIIETNLRRGLVMTDGIVDFLTRPMTALFLGLGLLFLLLSTINLQSKVERSATGDQQGQATGGER